MEAFDSRLARLREKYDYLCAKYDDLVKKYEARARKHVGVVRLGWWALRTSESGLALVREDRIELCNSRWHDFSAPLEERERWERIEGAEEEQRVFASLREVAQNESHLLLSSPGAPASRISRFRRTTSQQVLEIRSERVEFEKDVIAILAHDVTKHVQSEVELRLARDALYHRDRLQVIGQVASGVAHDLNNALNVMRLRLELLRLKASSQEHQPDLAAFAQIIDAAAARVARMQDLSRKQLEATIEPLDLRRVVEEAIALAQTQFEQHSLADGRHFRISCKIGKLPSIRADVAELEHLFVNLLLNARDAMPKGGEISIHARREGNYAVVTVADEGTGIPADHLERIFDSFFTTKGKEGTGLGLAMARGTMARLGGTIHARNREHGAEFTLRFPLSLEAPAPAKPAAPVATVEEPIRRDLRILLVDDDADCREVTQAVLEGEGLTVETARSGATALEMLSRNTYDLLLCDVGMPEMSGWQVAQEARQLRPAMAIYMVTGWAGQFESADSHRDDADGILGKPLQMDELRSVIARIGAGTAPNAHAQA